MQVTETCASSRPPSRERCMTCDCLVLECPAPCTAPLSRITSLGSHHERHAAYTRQASHKPSGSALVRKYTRKAQVLPQKHCCSLTLAPNPLTLHYYFHHHYL
ncbi:hypothetical protein BC827DRAFT_820188 [Russula dissimulans]|nr:hypothetical protein BC827DRAFT_820188 [Russula dissimulans]